MKSISHTACIAILLTSNGMIAQAKGYPTHDLARCAGIMMGLGKMTMRYPGSSQAGLDLWNEGLTTLRLFSTHGTGWEMKTFNDTFKAVEYGGAEALRIAQSMVSPCRKLISKTVADEEKAIKEKAKAREEYLKTPAGKAELAEIENQRKAAEVESQRKQLKEEELKRTREIEILESEQSSIQYELSNARQAKAIHIQLVSFNMGRFSGYLNTLRKLAEAHPRAKDFAEQHITTQHEFDKYYSALSQHIDHNYYNNGVNISLTDLNEPLHTLIAQFNVPVWSAIFNSQSSQKSIEKLNSYRNQVASTLGGFESTREKIERFELAIFWLGQKLKDKNIELENARSLKNDWPASSQKSPNEDRTEPAGKPPIDNTGINGLLL